MRLRLGSLAGGLAVIVAAPLFAFASSLPSESKSPESISVSHRTTQSASSIRQYWTRSRMRNAQPADLQIVGAPSTNDSQAVDRGAPRRIEPNAAGDSHPVADPGAPGYRAHGKVFFTSNKGYDYQCSGTVVSSPGENTVATAGHCVYGPESDTFMHNWLFIPAYADGKDPFGTWTAEELFTTQGWMDHDFDFDVAFARMGPNGGESIQDTVGARGILFNQEPFQDLDAIGYPAAYPFNGRKMIVCETEVDKRHGSGANAPLRMPCDMTGGSSGGGWVIEGQYVFSVVSYSILGKDGYLFGPYLGSVAEALYDVATGGQIPDPEPTPVPTVVPTEPPTPEPSPTDEPSDPVTHQVFLSLQLSGGLVASGELSVPDGFDGCTSGVTVEVYRIRRGTGLYVDETVTENDGSYSVGLKDRPGKYFAFSLGGPASDRDVCSDGVSKVARNPR